MSIVVRVDYIGAPEGRKSKMKVDIPSARFKRQMDFDCRFDTVLDQFLDFIKFQPICYGKYYENYIVMFEERDLEQLLTLFKK